VKHWKETSELLARAASLEETGRPAALATVVAISGSAYRRPGAKFLVEQAGETSGSISGGCLEADVREVALGVMRENAPRLLHYDTGSDDQTVWGLGLGCSGSVDVFVQAIAPGREAFGRVRELLAGDKPFVVSTVIKGSDAGGVLVFDSESAQAGGTGDAGLDGEIAANSRALLSRRETKIYTAGSSEVFTEVLVPPPHLIIFGAGDDAIPLCRYASDAGFRVAVVDHRGGYLSAPRFPQALRLVLRRPEEGTASLALGPNTYTIVKTHSFAHDREWVRQLLPSGVPYIGIVGPRARTAELLSQIGAASRERVFGPVGLDLGAEGPEQVALAIVAELLAVRSAREPWSLRVKEGAIHAG
jgi:xanthine/CO dehydrogenase XdhC/CoxF family maturation factor